MSTQKKKGAISTVFKGISEGIKRGIVKTRSRVENRKKTNKSKLPVNTKPTNTKSNKINDAPLLPIKQDTYQNDNRSFTTANTGSPMEQDTSQKIKTNTSSEHLDPLTQAQLVTAKQDDVTQKMFQKMKKNAQILKTIIPAKQDISQNDNRSFTTANNGSPMEQDISQNDNRSFTTANNGSPMEQDTLSEYLDPLTQTQLGTAKQDDVTLPNKTQTLRTITPANQVKKENAINSQTSRGRQRRLSQAQSDLSKFSNRNKHIKATDSDQYISEKLFNYIDDKGKKYAYRNAETQELLPMDVIRKRKEEGNVYPKSGLPTIKEGQTMKAVNTKTPSSTYNDINLTREVSQFSTDAQSLPSFKINSLLEKMKEQEALDKLKQSNSNVSQRKINELSENLDKQERKQQELLFRLDRSQDNKAIEKVNVTEKSAGPSRLFSNLIKSKSPDYNTELINQYTKEFVEHVGKMKSLSSELLQSFETQATNLNKGISVATDVAKKKAGLKTILDLANTRVNQYKRKSIQFLLDTGFRKKADFLLQNHEKSYKSLVASFQKDITSPFFKKLQSLILSNFKIDSTTEDRDDLQYDLDALIDKISNVEEKLYAVYNNKIDIMDIFNPTFVLVYSLKSLRVFFLWFSLYLASKIFQEKYVTAVFANNDDPPKLINFILIFWGLETLFMVAVTIILFLLKFLNDKNGDFIVNMESIKKFLIDYAISTVFILLFGLLLSSIFMKKKYFRYKTDGLRAIRSLQEVMLSVGSVIALLPFFMLL